MPAYSDTFFYDSASGILTDGGGGGGGNGGFGR